MDGGQVALSKDATTQFSAWMNNEKNQRRLFFAAVKPGETPKASALVEYEGQQGHPVVSALTDGRALVALEAGDGIAVALISADGKVEKKENLCAAGKFPRLLQTGDAAYVAWESMKGAEVRRVNAAWWATGEGD